MVDVSQPQAQSLMLQMPTRPQKSQNVKFQPIKLISNHYPVTLLKTKPTYQYSFEFLDIEVEKDSRSMIKSLLRKVRPEVEKDIGEKFFQSGWVIFGSKKISSEFKTYVYQKKTEKESDFALKLTYIKEMSIQNSEKELSSQVIQYMNIIVKQMWRQQKYFEIGTNTKFYKPDDIQNIPNSRLKFMSGVFNSIRNLQRGVNITIDFSSRLLRQDTCLEEIYFLKNNNGFNNKQINQEFFYVSVLPFYGNYRIKQIVEVDFNKKPTDTFPDRNGKQISYIDYYKSKYGLKIKDLSQPLLRFQDRKTKQDQYLIPEFCFMTGMTDDMRSDFQLMKEVAYFTKKFPNDRMALIEQYQQALSSQMKKSDCQIQIQESPTLEGKLLFPPALIFGNNKKIVPQNGDFKRDCRIPVFNPLRLTRENWIFIYAARNNQYDEDYKAASQFVQDMKKAGSSYGIGVEDPIWIEVANKLDDPKEYTRELEQIVQKKKPIIVVSMIHPKKKEAIYSHLKKICIEKYNILHQNFLAKNYIKAKMSFVSNVLLQMNAKNKQILWKVEIPEIFLKRNTMIMGVDVYHQLNAKNQRNSVVGFCSTINKDFTQYYSRVSVQAKVGEEIMRNVGRLVKDAIGEYYKFNKAFPDLIIFYRDGVSDEQMKIVLEQEVQQCLKSFQELNQEIGLVPPQFMEIVVKKKINDRFFQLQQGGGGQGKFNLKNIINPQPGVVVSEGVVDNYAYEFFLIAQQVTQGTCTPTSYTVIYDDARIPEDLVQQLTYNLCYNYYNWTGTVKVPSIVQNAHKLAYVFGSVLVSPDQANKMDKFLYYL